MCDPVTLTIAASAVSAVGTLGSGFASYQAGNAQADVLRQNAKMDERAARDAIDRGDEAAAAHYREVSQLKGQQMAAMSANGIDVTFGSAAQLQADTAMLANQDASIILDNAAREAEGLRISAWNHKAAAKQAKAKGRSDMVSSAFSAAGTILGGASQVRGINAKYGTSAGKGGG